MNDGYRIISEHPHQKTSQINRTIIDLYFHQIKIIVHAWIDEFEGSKDNDRSQFFVKCVVGSVKAATT